jgi:hypothetical protein
MVRGIARKDLLECRAITYYLAVKAAELSTDIGNRFDEVFRFSKAYLLNIDACFSSFKSGQGTHPRLGAAVPMNR